MLSNINEEPIETLDDRRIIRMYDQSITVRSSTKPLLSRFSVAKLEDCAINMEFSRDDQSSSPSKRKLIVRKNYVQKTGILTPYVGTISPEFRALTENLKERNDKKIQVTKDWRIETKSFSSTRDKKTYLIDLDYGSNTKNLKTPMRSKSFRPEDLSSDTHNSLNNSQILPEIRIVSKSPVKVTSFRTEMECKFMIHNPRQMPQKQKTDFSNDK